MIFFTKAQVESQVDRRLYKLYAVYTGFLSKNHAHHLNGSFSCFFIRDADGNVQVGPGVLKIRKIGAENSSAYAWTI